MTAKKHPSKKFIKDLEAVFSKHNWTGSMIGISSEADANPCIPPKTPIVVHYTLNGKDYTKVVCV